MGDVAKAAGVGHSIKFRGKSYELKPETPEMIGRFEVWIEGQAWAAWKRAARYMSPADHKEMRSETNRDIASCVYSYGTDRYATASRSMAGFRERLLIAIKDDGADEELVAAMTDNVNDPETFKECVRLMNLRDGVIEAEGDDASNAPGDGSE